MKISSVLCSCLVLLAACTAPSRVPPPHAYSAPPPPAAMPVDEDYATLAPASGGTMVVPPPPAGPAMTQAELRRCVELDRNAKSGANEMAQVNRSLTQRRAMIDEESARIEARRPGLDLTSRPVVEDFNRRVAALGATAAAFNADTAREQVRVDVLNRQINDYNSQCSGRRYHISDMGAVAGDKYLRLGNPR
ncbi:MAG TPA: hypothetical protein VM074_05545 [Solimonas sp.]|nr:hypothetical protein [Solimonas sp.]